jgi:hypothetical protein
MLDILERIESVLRKYGHYGQANLIAEIGELHRSGSQAEFQKAVTGSGMWGGAGSMSDVAIVANAREITPEVQADERRFRSDIVALAEELEKESLGSPRTRQIAAVFRSWNARAI